MATEQTYSVKELANWVLDFAEHRGERLTNMAFNKLVYFAYEFSLREKGRKLTAAKIEAWDHGPVFREVYSAFKNFGADQISSRASRYNTGTNSVEIVIPDLAPNDEAIMVEALDSLIRLPAYILRELSHEAGGAWDRVWNHDRSSNPGMEISDDLILESAAAGRD